MKNRFKKIAVTGSTGLLASKLIAFLKSKDLEVLALSSANKDYADSLRLKERLSQCDAVIHCAGKVSYDSKESKKIYAANYHFTKFFLDIAKECKIKRFIHVSSIVTFGHSRELRNEESEYNAKNLNLAYWNSKYEAEALALSKNSKTFEVLSVNPGTILGGDPTKSLFTVFVRKLRKIPFILVPQGGSDFVWVDDVAEGCYLALEHGIPGQRYILGSENLSYLELYKRIRKISGKTGLGLQIPTSFLKYFDSPRLRRMNGIYMYHQMVKAKKELSYSPHPIDQALKELF